MDSSSPTQTETTSAVTDAHPIAPPARKPRRINWLLLVCVLIPSLISTVYFGLIASDVFISESRFVIRTPQRSQQPSVIGALLQGNAFMRSQDDAFSVHDYMLSRDALRELDTRLQMRKLFGSSEIDLFNRFPQPFSEDKFELLYKYYGKRVAVEYDASTSITTLKVNAFAAKDAFAINETLLALGESLVNQINDRAREDLIKYAQAEVAEAEGKARAAALALASYRSDRSVFDPERQSLVQLQQIGKLQDELIAARSQLLQVQSLSPQNPQIPVLQQRVKILQGEMATEMGKVAGADNNSLSNKAAKYERLLLERTFADRQLASALSSLESARNEARRKQLYLERVVQANVPDHPLEPRRLRSIVGTLMLGLAAWGVLSMFLAGVREHRD